MAHNVPATGTGLSSKIVLIADDDQTIRMLVSATLASDQYSVLEAADGEEAWRLIRQYHPAVLTGRPIWRRHEHAHHRQWHRPDHG